MAREPSVWDFCIFQRLRLGRRCSRWLTVAPLLQCWVNASLIGFDISRKTRDTEKAGFAHGGCLYYWARLWLTLFPNRTDGLMLLSSTSVEQEKWKIPGMPNLYLLEIYTIWNDGARHRLLFVMLHRCRYHQLQCTQRGEGNRECCYCRLWYNECSRYWGKSGFCSVDEWHNRTQKIRWKLMRSETIRRWGRLEKSQRMSAKRSINKAKRRRKESKTKRLNEGDGEVTPGRFVCEQFHCESRKKQARKRQAT